MTAIDVRLLEVTKSFGNGILAVDRVSLDVLDGEFFSLLGPSGCGKTTTLRMIGGFEEPTSGRIELQGQDVTWLPPYKRNVNTVFQNYALFPHLSIFENVAFGLRRKKVASDQVRQRVGEMLELVELRGFEQRRPGQISGGQAQRVALARALINRPAVLLLDEPLGALDLKLRKQMQLELKRIQQEVGITFIYVTHDQDEAMTMSDRICVMHGGRYEQLGPPQELYERPQTRFVASFLGISNLMAASSDGVSDGYAVARLRDGTEVRLPRPMVDGSHDLELGVRPEKIRLHPAAGGAETADNLLHGHVRDVSYTGVSTQYLIDLSGGGAMTVYEQNSARAEGRLIHRPGEEVAVAWSPDDTFVVRSDAATAA